MGIVILFVWQLANTLLHIVWFNGTTTLHVDDESFGSILLIEGNATIENNGTTLEVNKGDSVFIDANSGNVKITGNCQWIYSRV